MVVVGSQNFKMSCRSSTPTLSDLCFCGRPPHMFSHVLARSLQTPTFQRLQRLACMVSARKRCPRPTWLDTASKAFLNPILSKNSLDSMWKCSCWMLCNICNLFVVPATSRKNLGESSLLLLSSQKCFNTSSFWPAVRPMSCKCKCLTNSFSTATHFCHPVVVCFQMD